MSKMNKNKHLDHILINKVILNFITQYKISILYKIKKISNLKRKNTYKTQKMKTEFKNYQLVKILQKIKKYLYCPKMV